MDLSDLKYCFQSFPLFSGPRSAQNKNHPTSRRSRSHLVIKHSFRAVNDSELVPGDVFSRLKAVTISFKHLYCSSPKLLDTWLLVISADPIQLDSNGPSLPFRLSSLRSPLPRLTFAVSVSLSVSPRRRIGHSSLAWPINHQYPYIFLLDVPKNS